MNTSDIINLGKVDVTGKGIYDAGVLLLKQNPLVFLLLGICLILFIGLFFMEIAYHGEGKIHDLIKNTAIYGIIVIVVIFVSLFFSTGDKLGVIFG